MHSATDKIQIQDRHERRMKMIIVYSIEIIFVFPTTDWLSEWICSCLILRANTTRQSEQQTNRRWHRAAQTRENARIIGGKVGKKPARERTTAVRHSDTAIKINKTNAISPFQEYGPCFSRWQRPDWSTLIMERSRCCRAKKTTDNVKISLQNAACAASIFTRDWGVVIEWRKAISNKQSPRSIPRAGQGQCDSIRLSSIPLRLPAFHSTFTFHFMSIDRFATSAAFCIHVKRLMIAFSILHFFRCVIWQPPSFLLLSQVRYWYRKMKGMRPSVECNATKRR